MGRFQYQARDSRGEMATGALMAPSLEEASRILRAQGKFIVRLQPTAEAPASEKVAAENQPRRSKSKVKREEVIHFTQQLAVMIETGVPISEALQCLREQAQTHAFAAVLDDVTSSVQGGSQLSAALRRHPAVFPAIMVSLVRASEVSGTMGPMLERVSGYLTKELHTMRQVRSALTYPIFMLVMAATVTGFLLAVVLPKFATIYEGRGATLPAPTRLLMGINDVIVMYWWAILIGGGALGFAIMMFRQSVRGRRAIDWLKLNIPIIRNLYTQLYISRACRTMGTMLSSGVSMLDMIAVVRDVTENVHFQEMWDQVDQRLKGGAQFSDTLAASKLVPKSVSQMVRSGERSGRLGQVLSRVAEFSEQEFDRAVKTTTQFIEPLMVGVMGMVVGFIAIALLLPIFSVGKVVGGQ